MNREIKFRGQRIDTKEWVFGYYSEHPKMREYPDQANPPRVPFITDFMSLNMYEVIPKTVGQYVGLDDTKEKGIYEGDKVSAFDHYTQTQFEGVVGFRHGGFMIYNEAMSHFRLSDYEMEVTGDIFSNPVKEGI